ncbi:MAG: YitT family protein [Bacteriovoracaceae bacterium]
MNKGFLLIFEILMMSVAAFLAALGIKSFLIPNQFIDGGVTGISILVSIVTKYPISYFVFLLNLPFLYIGYRSLGLSFALKSIFSILAFCFFLSYCPMPELTQDKLLAAIFGGGLIGAGIGLSIRSGAVLDGTEIMAIVLSKQSIFSIGEFILAFNILIFAVGALLLGLEISLYSILTYFSATKMVDFMIHGFEENTAVMINSDKSKEIKEVIISELKLAVTIFEGRKGMSNQGQEILYCVVTRLEIMKIKRVVKEIDDKAFVVTYRIDDTVGGMIKKKPFH